MGSGLESLPLDHVMSFLVGEGWEWSEDLSAFVAAQREILRSLEKLFSAMLEEMAEKWPWVRKTIDSQLVFDRSTGGRPTVREIMARLSSTPVFIFGRCGSDRSFCSLDRKSKKPRIRSSTAWKHTDGSSMCWHQGRIFLGGGGSPGWGVAEVYNPITDSWSCLPDLPVRAGSFVSYQNELLLIGGVDKHNKRTDSIYTLADDDMVWRPWTHKGLAVKLPQRMSNHTAVSVGQNLYVFGGLRDSVQPKTAIEIPQPSSEVIMLNGSKRKVEWHKTATMQRQRCTPLIHAKGHCIYLQGGDRNGWRKALPTMEYFVMDSSGELNRQFFHSFEKEMESDCWYTVRKMDNLRSAACSSGLLGAGQL